MSNTSEHFVSFNNVTKSYDGKSLVIDNMNLGLKKGEFVSLLGPSGSGKTTCLMMLAGFETITDGEILIDGTPVHHIPPNKRGIGMVFQNYALFPHMSVFENLAFPLEIRKMAKDEIDKKVKIALERVRLSDFANRRISQLSGGQQQRVAVARSIVFEAEIVLMDEPLGALDKNLREEMQFEIKHLHEQLGITILYVTHDQTEAITMSDRVAVFNNGDIQQYSTPNDLYERPQNSFVADFIGENNSLKGSVTSTNADGECTVKVDTGIKIKGLNINNKQKGESVVISVRPEKVIINPDSADSTINTVEGLVKEVIYMGDHTRLRLNIAGNDEFIVKILNNQTETSYREGVSMKLGWRTQHCCVLGY